MPEYVFHLVEENRRLVVSRGDEVVTGDELNKLCLRLNAREKPNDGIGVEALELRRMELDGERMGVEGSDGIAVVRLMIGGEWHEIIKERFDASFGGHGVSVPGILDAIENPPK